MKHAKGAAKLTKVELLEEYERLRRSYKRLRRKDVKLVRVRDAAREAMGWIQAVGENDYSQAVCDFCTGRQSDKDPRDVDHEDDCAWVELSAALDALL